MNASDSPRTNGQAAPAVPAEENPDTQAQAERSFHWFVAASLTLWCLFWLALNGFNYVRLTWLLFAHLKWWSFFLAVNPCFWIWAGLGGPERTPMSAIL